MSIDLQHQATLDYNAALDYDAALDYIYSFVDYSLTHQQNLAPENFDLTRMFAFMDSLGNPQNSYPGISSAEPDPLGDDLTLVTHLDLLYVCV